MEIIKKNYEREIIEREIPDRPMRSLRKSIKKTKPVKKPIIAEIKPKGPDEKKSRKIDVEKTAKMFEKYAAGISVLTEPFFFDGNIFYLKVVHDTVRLPVLRKDFILRKDQIRESASLYADAVLLITSCLKEELGKMLDECDKYGLEALVEVKNEEEIELALNFGSKIIGINNRDLNTLEIDKTKTIRLAGLIPNNITKIGMSGYSNKKEVNEALKHVDALLIGKSIMDNPDKLRELVS
ncbi:MAG: indole-3-glycerol-phosphate synthase [Candidatus Hydrothermarchaeota archaeon]